MDADDVEKLYLQDIEKTIEKSDPKFNMLCGQPEVMSRYARPSERKTTAWSHESMCA